MQSKSTPHRLSAAFRQAVTTEEIWSAARGLDMWAKTPQELDDLADLHGRRPEFASQVIAAAARQVRGAKMSAH